MKKIQVNLSWTPSVDAAHTKGQTVQVGDAKQSLSADATTFSFFEEENTSYTASVFANTADKVSVPLVFTDKTPFIADVITPAAPTAASVTYEVVDVQ